MREIFNKILEKLSELELDFQKNQGIILTEYDLQCLVFHKIYDLFSHDMATFDLNIKGSPLHTEIKFFNDKGKLYYRPDLTIIKPDNYSIIHSIAEFVIKEDKIKYKPTSSKEFEFGGDSIIIELKYCRGKMGISKIDSFNADLKKIQEIKGLVENDNSSKVYGIVAIFNKTDKKIDKLLDFVNSCEHNSDIKIKYYTGKVEI
jgi:hypothetical protein